MSQNIERATWKYKMWQEIRVIDMTDDHLVNSINLLRRKADDDYVAYKMAENWDCDDPDVYFTPEPDHFLPAIYNDLIFEMHKRGIELEPSAIEKANNDR